MTTTLAPSWIPNGFQVLDGQTLGLLVVDGTYTFDESHVTVADIVDFEVTGTGYARFTAMGEAVRGEEAWTLFLNDVGTTDLSAIDSELERAGVWLYRVGSSDATSPLIGFSEDPGPPVDPYEPTWPDGFYELLLRSFSIELDLLGERITGMEGRTVAGVAFLETTGDVPTAALAEALSEYFAPADSGRFPDYSEPVQGVDEVADGLFFASHRGWIHAQGAITATSGTGGSSQFANLPALTVPSAYRPLAAVLLQAQTVCLWGATIDSVASEGLALFSVLSDGSIGGSRMTGTEWDDETDVTFFPSFTYPDTTTYVAPEES